MSYQTLSDSHRKNQYKFLALVGVTLLTIHGISNSFAQEAQSITLTTNKSSYLPGDTVQLSGMATGQPNLLVALQVRDSNGNLILIRTIQTDQNGNFAIQFKIPPTATSGRFSIMASARINGFVVTQTKVISASVPEFGQIAGEVLGFSTMIIVLIFAISERLQK